MEQVRKLRVAMVCHLSSPRIRAHLPLCKKGRFNWLRKLFGIRLKNDGYFDFAIWNINLANFFSSRNDIDFTIISPHAGLKRFSIKYEENGVKYIFLNYHWSNLVKRIGFLICKKSRINPLSWIVKYEINSIQPDLVVLMGLENSYYSSTILGITKYPVYGLCQTVYNNPSRKDFEKLIPELAENEMLLLKELNYIGVACRMHYELVRQYSPHSTIFKFGFLNKGSLLVPIETNKEYDFVNFAMTMSDSKGFSDTIKALAVVKKKHPNVKLDLIGQCSDNDKRNLESLVEELGLVENVVFTPFFKNQSDLFLYIQKSRFAVLPCKLDFISGTMSQAMQLGLPVVVYKTAGTPLFNREKPCVLIAEMENINELARHMISLMDSQELAETLKGNAHEWQNKKFQEEQHYGEKLVSNFYAIVENYKNGTPIPKEQLFNSEIDD